MSDRMEVDSILLSYKNRCILSDIYISCQIGQCVGIIGKNGEGKSSLMQIIFGTLNSQYKSIRCDGDVISSFYIKKNNIKYLPQNSFLMPYLSIKKVFDIYSIDINELYNNFIDFKINKNKKIRELSFGEKRLIEIIIIIKSNSKFILLDEPFTYIMPLHVEQIKKIIYSEKKHKGFIITDHLTNYISEVSDIIYLLDDCSLRKINSQKDFK